MNKNSPAQTQNEATRFLEIVLRIIKELIRIQGIPSHSINEGRAFPLPGLIAIDSDNGILVSHQIDTDIALLAIQLKRGNKLVRASFTRDEWIARVRSKFGPALASIDLDNDLQKNAQAVLEGILASVASEKLSASVYENVFGCSLFGFSNAPAVEMGPVIFQPRLKWLALQFETGIISKTIYRRMLARWQDRRPRKRKPSHDSLDEDAITQAIGDCSYVCSVNVSGFAMQAGQQRALMATRIALTAVALLWETPSKTLKGFNLLADRRPVNRNTLVITSGNLLGGGTRLRMPHGPWMKPEDWKTLHERKLTYFSEIQEIFENFLSPMGATKRPRLMSTLFQALLWFHEGCREEVDAIAVVKFSASLDALSVGGRSSGIRQLLLSRLGIKEQSVITKDGRTVKQAIDEIYGEGRSRTVHGTNENIAQDWSGARDLAEQLARCCLLSSIDWATTNKDLDDPSRLST